MSNGKETTIKALTVHWAHVMSVHSGFLKKAIENYILSSRHNNSVNSIIEVAALLLKHKTVDNLP